MISKTNTQWTPGACRAAPARGRSRYGVEGYANHRVVVPTLAAQFWNNYIEFMKKGGQGARRQSDRA